MRAKSAHIDALALKADTPDLRGFSSSRIESWHLRFAFIAVEKIAQFMRASSMPSNGFQAAEIDAGLLPDPRR
jgi:hypothetical protein